MPHIFKFLQDDKAIFLIIISVRIINQLLNEDYILLDEQQYVALTSMLAHKNDYISMKTETILLDNFLLKCKKTIVKHFVPSILYYNKYRHHPLIYIADDAVLFTLSAAQRRRIYKFLFDSMATSAQFSVINEMTMEILTKIVEGNLIYSADLIADCVAIIGLFLPHLGEEHSDLNVPAQTKLLNEIEDIVNKKTGVTATKYHDYQMVIKKFLLTLLNLTFQVNLVDDSLRPDLVRIVMRTTKVLLPEVSF